MMPKCLFCQEAIRHTHQPIVEIIGGFFDPPTSAAEKPMFITDDAMMQASYAHLQCLADAILAAKKRK